MNCVLFELILPLFSNKARLVQMILNLSSILSIKLLILYKLSHLSISQWAHSHSYLISPCSNAIAKWTEVSIGGVSDQGGELGHINDIKKRQLRHNSQNFQACFFVEIDFLSCFIYAIK